MFTEARKINLIEAVLKVSNEAVLVELETVIKKMPVKHQKRKYRHMIFWVYGVKKMLH